MTIIIEQWQGHDIARCAEALANTPYTVFLDSNRPEHPDNKFSILCWNPKKIFKNEDADQDLYKTLQSFLKSQPLEKVETSLPFYGGLIGYISYEHGVQTHNITPSNTSKLPTSIFGYYTCGIIYDHTAQTHYAFYQETQDIAFLQDNLRHPPINYLPTTVNWESSETDDEFKDSVTKIIELIHQGEVYQINMTRQFTTPRPSDFDSYGHYKILRDINPAPFSSFLNFDEFQVLSCSPERFLKIEDHVVETKPIKGTIPDNQSPNILLNSIKDRAENTMIVDLLRNDLSKVCENNSVTVPKLCKIESFTGLHHLVSTVRGILDKDKTAIDTLQACFPGGSITGAPKIAAMHHINALEHTPRGLYCGSIGYIGLNGTMDMNIVIRTMITTKDTLIINTGSGIVSDSVPQKELEETYNKIQKIFDSFDEGSKGIKTA